MRTQAQRERKRRARHRLQKKHDALRKQCEEAKAKQAAPATPSLNIGSLFERVATALAVGIVITPRQPQQPQPRVVQALDEHSGTDVLQEDAEPSFLEQLDIAPADFAL
jgi:hypothetical protein